jgi:hypothetical protein
MSTEPNRAETSPSGDHLAVLMPSLVSLDHKYKLHPHWYFLQFMILSSGSYPNSAVGEESHLWYPGTSRYFMANGVPAALLRAG